LLTVDTSGTPENLIICPENLIICPENLTAKA